MSIRHNILHRAGKKPPVRYNVYQNLALAGFLVSTTSSFENLARTCSIDHEHRHIHSSSTCTCMHNGYMEVMMWGGYAWKLALVDGCIE